MKKLSFLIVIASLFFIGCSKTAAIVELPKVQQVKNINGVNIFYDGVLPKINITPINYVGPNRSINSNGCPEVQISSVYLTPGEEFIIHGGFNVSWTNNTSAEKNIVITAVVTKRDGLKVIVSNFTVNQPGNYTVAADLILHDAVLLSVKAEAYTNSQTKGEACSTIVVNSNLLQ